MNKNKTNNNEADLTIDSNADTVSDQTVLTDTNKINTYTSDEYGFSFEYPTAWEASKVEMVSDIPEGRSEGSSLLFSVEFSNENMKLQIECVNNEYNNWTTGYDNPGSTECEPVTQDLSEDQKTVLLGPKHEENLMLSVYNNDSALGLRSWMIKEFKIPGTEQEDYEVGQPITLGALDGYYSDTGCCGLANRGYVASSGKYVYVLSTNYFTNSFDDKDMPEFFLTASKSFKVNS